MLRLKKNQPVEILIVDPISHRARRPTWARSAGCFVVRPRSFYFFLHKLLRNRSIFLLVRAGSLPTRRPLLKLLIMTTAHDNRRAVETWSLFLGSNSGPISEGELIQISRVALESLASLSQRANHYTTETKTPQTPCWPPRSTKSGRGRAPATKMATSAPTPPCRPTLKRASAARAPHRAASIPATDACTLVALGWPVPCPTCTTLAFEVLIPALALPLALPSARPRLLSEQTTSSETSRPPALLHHRHHSGWATVPRA